MEAFAGNGRFAVHPHVDERSAAFFALGAGARSGRPAVVVTTSGTAAANLLPAIVEASQSEIPLVALTADRPASLRGTDANQTIDQVELFGRYPRLFVDVGLPEPTEAALGALRATVDEAWHAAVRAPRGPVHLNIQFDKPLEPTPLPGDVPPGLEASLVSSGLDACLRPSAGAEAAANRSGGAASQASDTLGSGGAEAVSGSELAVLLQSARRLLVVCGPNHHPAVGRAALALAARFGAPLLADPLSGARFEEGAPQWTMASAGLYLGDPDVAAKLRPDLVLRIGRAPTSAAVCRFLELHSDVPQLALDAAHRWEDHLATSARALYGDPAVTLRDAIAAGETPPANDPRWHSLWRSADRAATDAVGPALAESWFEGAIAAVVAEALPERTTLFIGNSMPIRDVDDFARATGRSLRTVGFRGASGIDGNVSGALGAAVASGNPSAAIIGDLTLLHDAGALLANLPPAAALHLIVIQNGGGGIFRMLPISDYDPPFTPFVTMPQAVDLGAVAAAAGIPHRAVSSVAALREEIGRNSRRPGVRLTEARVDSRENWRQRVSVVEMARQAAREAL